jgi:N-acetylglucosamine kinase-like BadF-type ATPase
VAEAAEAGDREAAAVVQRSALALADLVAGVSQALHLEAPAVCAVGGAVEHLRPLRSGLESALAAQVPGARLEQPQGDACDGALALAAGLPALSLG